MESNFGRSLEEGSRDTVLDQYNHWLYSRFCTIDFSEMEYKQEPMNLHAVFVLPRIGTEPVEAKTLSEPHKVNKEKEVGELASDILLKEPAVILSGPPGSGKSTLVSYLVLELTNPDGITDFQRKLHPDGVTAVPMILRDLPLLPNLSLEQVLSLWLEQVIHSEQRLKMPCLRQILWNETGKKYQIFLILDGLDEVGDVGMRRHVLSLVDEARNRGWRVLLTGRPSAFQDVDGNYPLHHLLPFSWQQINRFCRLWHDARPDWRKRKKVSMTSFEEALRDEAKPFLLEMARCPVFLTLMSLIHLNGNTLPDGRVDLYKQITQFYLVRQENQRQTFRRKYQEYKGEALPFWPEDEKHLALGFLAYQDLNRSSQNRRRLRARKSQRLFQWKREEILQILQEGLTEPCFKVLKPADAATLLSFFMHPAGLLISSDNGHVQFAHPSIQRYLCARYLKRRIQGDVLEQIRECLGKPSWGELAFLLLAQYSEQQEDLFNVLIGLDLTNKIEADLFMQAYTGNEINFTDKERREWLPRAVAACLLHPDKNLGHGLRRQPGLSQEFQHLMSELLQMEPSQIMVALERRFYPETLTIVKRHWDSALKRWQRKDPSFYGTREDDQVWTPLKVIVDGIADRERVETLSQALGEAVGAWLGRFVTKKGQAAFGSYDREMWKASVGYSLLESLLPTTHPLWGEVCRLQPVFLCMLEHLNNQREYITAPLFGSFILFDEKETIHQTLLQMMFLLQLCRPQGQRYITWLAMQAKARQKACAWRQGDDSNQGKVLERARLAAHSPAMRFADSRARAFAPATERRYSRIHSQIQTQLTALFLARSHSREAAGENGNRPKSALSMALNTARAESQDFHLRKKTASEGRLFFPSTALMQAAQRLARSGDYSSMLSEALVCYLCQLSALLWYEKPTEGEPVTSKPIPGWKHLSMEGELIPWMERGEMLAMQRWLNEPERIIQDTYPQGLPDEDRIRYLKELNWLSQQPWSLQKLVEIVLDSWPEEESIRQITDLSEAERELAVAVEAFVGGDDPESDCVALVPV